MRVPTSPRSLASFYLFADVVSPGGVTALHAVGPHYCGEFHGSNSAGVYPGLRSVLAVAAALQSGAPDKDGRVGTEVCVCVCARSYLVGFVSTVRHTCVFSVSCFKVQLPPASKLMIALNAGLATRVHNTSAPAATDNKFWLRDSDTYTRDHLRDRGPDTAFDKVSCIQSMTAAGIITAFLEVRVCSVVCVCVR